MEQIKKALRIFELILTEFAGVEKIMTEEKRLQMLQICKDAQKQANGAEQSESNCNIPLVSNSFVYVLVADGLKEPIGIFTKYHKAYRLMKKLSFENSEIQRWRLD